MTTLPDHQTLSLNHELHTADPALVGNSAVLAAVLDSSGDCIKILDLEGRLQFMSEGGKRVMEVDDFSVLKGCPWPDFWAGAGNQDARNAVEAARAGKSSRFLGAADTAKGNPRFWDVRVMPIADAEGNATHILSISTDITATRAAELSARENQVQMKLALAASEMGVWQCRLVAGEFTELSGDPRAMMLLGAQPGQDWTFADFAALLAPEDRTKLVRLAMLAMRSSEDGILNLECRILGIGDASDRWLQARAQILSSSVGKRLIGTVQDITERKETELRQTILSGELQHRVKNILAMVSAIAMQTLRGEDIASRRQTFSSRLEALANANDILTTTTWRSASLRSVIGGSLGPHMAGEDRIIVRGVDIDLTARQALSVALAIHELATNAVKYGALSTSKGTVEISWSLSGEEFRLIWQEHGGPVVVEPSHKGFGSRLITRVLAADFKGTVNVDYHRAGLVCTLVSPASQVGAKKPDAVGIGGGN